MAGRRRTIDRDRVLDVAETIVREHGPAALTIGAVAAAAGITKGGVQYCFGTKEQLMDSMYNRWKSDFEARIASIAGENPSPSVEMRAYIAVARAETDPKAWARSSTMLALLLHEPQRLADFRRSEQARIDGLDLATEEGRQLAAAYVAAEGAFLLRGFQMLTFSAPMWDAIWSEVMKLVARDDPD